MLLAATFPSIQPKSPRWQPGTYFSSLIVLKRFCIYRIVISSIKVRKFLALFRMFFFYDWPFLHVCILHGNVYLNKKKINKINKLCSTLIRDSAFSDHVVFTGIDYVSFGSNLLFSLIYSFVKSTFKCLLWH